MIETREGASRSSTPRVWALLGRRAGDNAQIVNLAQQLGYPLEIKQLQFNWLSGLPNRLLGASRASLKADSRRLLGPPLPDAVVAAGRRSVPAARWIHSRSGGAVRLIHIGRPWGSLAWFDLVVTTPQYGLGTRPNVIHNFMPLLAPLISDGDAAGWEARLAHLPRPWIAVLVGGSSRPHVLDPAAAERLGRMADAAARETGGSLLATFGPRASPAAAAAFEAAIESPAHIHVIRSQGASPGRNPYRAYLRLADRFIVTGDSASMLAEAARSGRPVEVFPVPKRPDLRFAVGERVREGAARDGTLGRICGSLIDAGIVTSVRDLDRYHRELRRAGMLEAGDAAARRQAEELARTIARIRRLIEPGDRRCAPP